MATDLFSAYDGTACNHRRAEEIALALMGLGELPDEALAEAARWDRTGAAGLVGRAAIQRARAAVAPPREVRVVDVVSHGKAGTVSGWYSPDGHERRLFCHVIRFTSPSGREIAQLVSFEHRMIGDDV